jgi:acylphosphatase
MDRPENQAQMDDFLAKHIYISGIVQGVYYRAALKHKAEELGVEGWCRNMEDGRVEAQVQGNAEAVEALISWAYDGPPAARVQDIAISDTQPETLRTKGFEIR